MGEPEIDAAIVGGAAALSRCCSPSRPASRSSCGRRKSWPRPRRGIGLKIPFAVYMLKNRALGWLLGPVGILVTTAMSAGWFVARAWRHRRFRKLVRLSPTARRSETNAR